MSDAVARTRWTGIAAVLMAAVVALACARTAPPDDITVAWRTEPVMPAAGDPSRIHVSVRDAAGRPVTRARLTVDAHMSMPGMATESSPAREMGDGAYQAAITFSMRGSWTLVLDGSLADGRRLTRSLIVPDVH